MSEHFSLAGKAAIVTGAGSGIGRAIAIRLASARAHVAVWDLSPAAAEATRALIVEAGGSAEATSVDVSDAAAVERAVAAFAGERPRIDALVNNAGVASIGSLNRHLRKNSTGSCASMWLALPMDCGPSPPAWPKPEAARSSTSRASQVLSASKIALPIRPARERC